MFCTKNQLIAFEPNIAPYADRILAQAVKFGLINELRMANFLGHLAFNSKNFTKAEEDLSLSANALIKTWPTRFPDKETADKYAKNPEAVGNLLYSNSFGNKDKEGYKFRGRGFLYVRGKDNYDGASQFLYGDARLLRNPNLLLKPEGAVDAALWAWDIKYLNKLADSDDTVAITRKITGGTLAMNDCLRFVKQAKLALKS